MAAGLSRLPSRNSLTLRLLIGSSLLCGATLAAAYVLLTTLLDLQLKHELDRELREELRELAARVEIVKDPGSGATTLALPRAPTQQRFLRPNSGYYWQIEVDGGQFLTSPSLAGAGLPRADAKDKGADLLVREIIGPGSARLRLAQRSVAFDGLPSRVTLSVAGDLAPVMATSRELSRILASVLAVLGVGLVSVVVFQVRLGLRPLQAIKEALGEIRAGRERQISRDIPTEIAPLTDELNALLDHHRGLIGRARAQAGDLARGIELPLQVLREELEGGAEMDRDLLREQIAAINGITHRRMAIARASGGPNLLGARADAARTIEALAYTLRHIDADRRIKVRLDLVGRPLWFAGEAHDLSEMLGNLLDIARRNAARVMSVSAKRMGDRLRIAITDDGAKRPADIAPAQDSDAIEDVRLVIARELAVLYGGNLSYQQSGQSGTLIEVDLPAV